jgi:hypothetical protein
MTDVSAPGPSHTALRETTAGDDCFTRSASVMCNLLFFALLPFLSCCHESGTWQNDAKNWKRAFGEQQPKKIKVTNSWFWRSPHFTHEFEYFFAVAPNDAFRRQLIEPGNLLKGRSGSPAARPFRPARKTTSAERTDR